MNIKELRLMNDTTILYLKKMNQDCTRNQIIKKILADEACFFKMKQEDAYVVLENIGVGHDKVPSLYTRLVSYDNYDKFVSNGTIKEDDPELIIKYSPYSSDDLFKKKPSK